MRLTDKTLKEIFQQQTARSSPRQNECITEEQLTRAASGAISNDERRKIANHLITCIDCTEDYRALLSLKPWAEEAQTALAPSTDHSVTTSRPDRVRFWQRLIWEPRYRAVAAIAAIVVIVAGSSLIVWQSKIHQEPPASSERAPISLGLNVEPPNKATINQPPETLSWAATEGGLTYRVVLYDFQSTPIWESGRLKEGSATLPEAIRQVLLRNQPYYWRIIFEDKIEQRQSQLFQFTITGEHR
jgi:hypothetical protein